MKGLDSRVGGDDASSEVAYWKVSEECFQELGVSVLVGLLGVESAEAKVLSAGVDGPFGERSKNDLYPNEPHGLPDK